MFDTVPGSRKRRNTGCVDNTSTEIRSMSPSTNVVREEERRVRREIANSNERRRMQSINSGFRSLKALLPSHNGDKLSKSSILSQTADYIYHMEQEKTKLLQQNITLKRLLSDTISAESKQEKLQGTEDLVSLADINDSDVALHEMQKEMLELRSLLDRERRLRLVLEEQLKALECHLYPAEQRAPGESQLDVTEVKEYTELEEVDTGSDNLPGNAMPSAAHLIPYPTPIVTSSTPLQDLAYPQISSSNIILTHPSVDRLHIDPLDSPSSHVTFVIQGSDPPVAVESVESSNKGNLQTIVEAIQHLERQKLLGLRESPNPVRMSVLDKDPNT